MATHSLSRRLLLSISVPLVLFFGATIVVFDASFRDVSNQSLKTLLDAEMLALIGSADADQEGRIVPQARALESRLANPGSGLYAQIRASDGTAPWRSQSTAGSFIDFGPALPPGARRETRTRVKQETLAIESRGIAFEDDGRRNHNLTFSVAASLKPYEAQLWTFRKRLFGWFIGLTALLLITLGVLLRWVLTPVRRMEWEIHQVEEGALPSLGEGYPRELSGVAGNLNTLLAGERKRVARYRDTLGNLAHSLKTPLAVVRSALAHAVPDTSAIGTQVDRMQGIVEHQLKRAAASGGALLGQAPVDLAPMVAELRVALLKVYGAKDFSLEAAIDREAQFMGDRADLMELVGNVLDNACKWCRGRVRIETMIDAGAAPREGLRISVEDDGPGISAVDWARVLERGVRADEKVEGHGLGLAMVRETVELYGGRLTLEISRWNGAKVVVRLPGRARAPLSH